MDRKLAEVDYLKVRLLQTPGESGKSGSSDKPEPEPEENGYRTFPKAHKNSRISAETHYGSVARSSEKTFKKSPFRSDLPGSGTFERKKIRCHKTTVFHWSNGYLGGQAQT